MTFSISKHDGRTHSLEFDETELPALREFLHSHFKEIDIQEHVIHDDVVIAGTRLLFYYEWDPCLISMDEEGGHLLDFIFTRLSAGET
ncbi:MULTISPECIES: hypothetical protein [unclassified Rhizobium]|uniref:hypothetical protein n=1 Tax=unclassified Rhizobium TaxID=2613769 RepID=UPI000712FB9D|nr:MULTISPECIES: hypothetical protein [unclassified Rhizobium]KQS96441.1 hypothetical protein ASG50_05125 [Rhizobium sp. Leaf386]KQT06280.1 hypothetical protein ASG42_01370 [Rhizobium sp. Leaf391]KQU09485.1 hypothetical protein ASG68_00250 [Rhizobium sp. Leaf453]